MPKLDMTRDARKFLDDLDANQYRQVTRKMLSLLQEPRPPDSAGLKGSRYIRADVGEFRIIYEIDETQDTVVIVVIGKRNDDEVYKRI